MDLENKRGRTWAIALAAGVVAVAVVGAIMLAGPGHAPGGRNSPSPHLPAPPTGLRVAIDGLGVELTWDPPRSEGEADVLFEVRRDGSLRDVVAGTEWTEEWRGEEPEPGGVYSYSVATVERSGSTRTTSPPSEPVRAELPMLSVEDARLAGEFNLSQSALGHSDSWDRSALRRIDSWDWVYVPLCQSGPCGVRVSMNMSDGWLHFLLRHVGEAEGVRSSWLGSLKNARNWPCNPDGSTPKASFVLKPVTGTWRDGQWFVGSLVGIMDIRFRPTSDCRYSWLTYHLKGVLESPPDSDPAEM